MFMRKEFLLTFFVLMLVINCLSAFSQEVIPVSVTDSLQKAGVIFRPPMRNPEISLTTKQAIKFLHQRVNSKYWNNPDDPFRTALNQLIFEASHERFDSAAYLLKKYPYDSLSIPWDKFYIWEPLRLKVPFVPVPLVSNDSSAISDSSLIKPDTIRFNAVVPASRQYKDSTIMVVIDTLENARSATAGFPFKYMDFPYQADSIKVAVGLLLDYLEKRDSSVIRITGLGKESVPLWMNSRRNEIMRFWLKNEFADSVTVWVGNESKNTIGLYLEKGINFRKPAKQENYSEARINVQKIDRSKLLKVDNIVVKKNYWKYRTESSLIFSQSALSNWVKGGENSVSTALDMTAYADYRRPELKLSSSNFVRLKLGFLKSGDEDIRKNLDLLETNSKLNHKAFGKFDFSAIMLFKTQVAVGKAYSKLKNPERDTAIVVSRFFNPAILTIGIGLDYKPNKETSINFSPLSYKGTFVPDGGKITKDSLVAGKLDQTRFGVPLGKTSYNEPGASFLITKISRPYKNLTVTNRLQLFTNYINNPQNIDIDWEMIADMNLNWFTNLRLNTHFIFDDDTKTPLIKGGVPVLMEDKKTPKKTARAQFKEMFGVSLVFRF
jgi:hypothetical protein